MSLVRAFNISMSVDGFVAGPDQSIDHPLGLGGEALHEWVFPPGGVSGTDAEFAARRERGVGATIMGRNMFGPIRGGWGEGDWRGWWGEDPPFHHPTFVLTHHPQEPIEMAGGTTFHFVTDGIESALARAHDAAGEADVAIGGGASTLRQYLRAGLVDDLHVVVVPILLRHGEPLFADLGDALADYRIAEHVATDRVSHVRLVHSRTVE